VGLLLLVGALAYEWQQQKAAPQFVAPAREEAKSPEPPQTVAAVPPAPPPLAEEKKPEPVAPPPAKLQKLEKKAEKQAEKQAEARAESPPPSGVHRIVLRTEAEAWLEVKDASGRTLISWLAPAGSERSVRGQPPFEIVLGNASAVRLTYDGRPVDLRPYTRVEVARFTLK
jgi:cytoskeleton protein RodZ